MSQRRGRWLCAVTVLGVLLLPGTAQAAAPSVPPIIGDVAAALRTDPVYVNDNMDRTVPAADHALLEAAVHRSSGYSIYAIAMPVIPGSRVPNEETLLSFVHSAVGRPGVYVVSSDDGEIAAQSFGVDAPAGDAATAISFEAFYDVRPAVMIDRFVTLLLSGNAVTRAADDQDHFDALQQRKDAHEQSTHFALDHPWFHLGLGVAGGTGLVTLVALLALRRGRLLLTALSAPPGSTDGPVPAQPHPPQPALLERTVGADLRRLQSRLASVPDTVPAPRRDRAFDSAAAASRLLDTDQSDPRARTCALVGATVLCRQGLALLAAGPASDSATVDRPCFFNPLHTGKPTMVRWRDGRHQEAEVPACRHCAAALLRHAPPDVLLLVSHAGDLRPWYQADCSALWARTGFGSLRDDLAGQVLSEPLGRKDKDGRP